MSMKNCAAAFLDYTKAVIMKISFLYENAWEIILIDQ